MPELVPPRHIDGYQLLRLLGQGTMGHVFLAEDAVLERQVAIKLLSSTDPRPQENERLLQEARAIARLSHPNVVAIYRVGEHAGRPYLVSEFVRGESLDKVDKPMPWETALHIGVGVSRGLAAAHRRGVVHRDIKPANVLLSEDGEAKLVDFGLAKLLDARPRTRPPLRPAPGPLLQAGALDVTADLPLLRETREPMALAPDVSSPNFTESETLRPLAAQACGLEETGEGAILGTPLYMAPECWRGEQATFRSDVFSLGAVLYHLCAGHPPHEGPGLARVRAAALSQAGAPEAPLGGIDPRFARAIVRCLRRHPAERFASAEELRQALEAIASQVGPRPRLPRAFRGSRSKRAFALSALAAALGAALFIGTEHAHARRLAAQLASAEEALQKAQGRCAPPPRPPVHEVALPGIEPG